MKKILALLCILALAASAGGCGASEKVQPPQTEPVPETTVFTEPELPIHKELFLTVSSITFSTVGETEDIYLGTEPRESVTWRSDDESIVRVDGGVLTAAGVGSTTIYAACGDSQVSCIAECLAQTQEELLMLPPEILEAPKRVAPAVDMDAPCTYFDDAAILGDSITYFLMQEEAKNDGLGKVTFLTRNGISIHGLVLRSKNLYFEGKPMNVEDVVASSGAHRVYMLLGCLDYQVPESREQIMDNWNILLDRIGERCPDVQLVIVSNIPCSEKAMKSADYNKAVAQTTAELKLLAADKGCGFLDLGRYIQDHYGTMPKAYTKDEFHMNAEGSTVWMNLLRYYAQYERAGGSLF